MQAAYQDLLDFLACPTPPQWIERALQEPEILLIDHANCEKKAASTALNLMFRYVAHYDLQEKMSRLAREELRHYEQVLRIMKKRGVAYGQLNAARYAEGLRKHMRKEEPDRLIDVLIIGALIEARSCERFMALAPHLDEELSAFYTSLLKSEARHFRDYLGLAQRFSKDPIDARVRFFVAEESRLIRDPDPQFRFHSGIPLNKEAVCVET